jgi:hypothetical protein
MDNEFDSIQRILNTMLVLGLTPRDRESIILNCKVIEKYLDSPIDFLSSKYQISPYDAFQNIKNIYKKITICECCKEPIKDSFNYLEKYMIQS